TEERRRRDQAAGHDGDVLLAVELIGHGAGADSGARVELPEELPRAGIERLEPALNVPWNTSPPAVGSMPPMKGSSSLFPQTFTFLMGSQAIASLMWPPGPTFARSHSDPR